MACSLDMSTTVQSLPVNMYLQHHSSKLFFCLDFYRAPIELEALDDDILLGFKISISNKTCLFVMPNNDWQYRSAKSAGTLQQNLSGLTSRLYTIMRGTFPKSYAKPSCRQLCQKYIKLGFHKADVELVYKKVVNECRSAFDLTL